MLTALLLAATTTLGPCAEVLVPYQAWDPAAPHAWALDLQAPDGGRLVQVAFWYILYDDGDYPTGNLYDAPADRLTPLGEALVQFVE